MKQRSDFPVWTILIPLAAFIVLVFIILSFSKGRSIDESSYETPMIQRSEILDHQGEYYLYSGEADDATYIIAFDGTDNDSVIRSQAIAKALDTLRLEYSFEDISLYDIEWERCQMLFLCFPDLNRFSESQFERFVSWLQTGDLFWVSGFDMNERFRVIYRLLGIVNMPAEEEAREYLNYTFCDDILPGLEGVSLETEDSTDHFHLLSLQEECTVHIKDTDTGTPLLWSFRGENNHVSVFNCMMFYEKNVMNGLINHLVARHRTLTIWPITNSLLVYIDDFPAPQPDGFDERLKAQFGYNTQGFFMNIWWPDMKIVADKYGLLYTGVFVETYNDNMEPPFEKGVSGSLLRYYSSELVSEGGEISLHGYNHQSLIPEGYPNTDGYKGWPSQENMVLACEELISYAHDLLPELTFTSYVPPLNYLSDMGYEALLTAVPSLKVISGLYYDYEGGTSLNGDFLEHEDGIVDVPRITSGYSPSSFDVLRMYSSLFDLGVFSHFIHPDDVLDDERGAILGWRQLYSDFDSMFEGIYSTYPQIRAMTATSGGGAVQRSQYLVPFVLQTLSMDGNDAYQVNLDGFVDVAWLGLCSEKDIVEVSGGQAFRISGDYWWIRADQKNITIVLGDSL